MSQKTALMNKPFVSQQPAPQMTKEVRAFLEMLKLSEGTFGVGDNGYNVLVGSTGAAPKLFDSYADHPRQKIWLPSIHTYSTAAGAYQVLAKIFDDYKSLLNLQDFSPAAQDMIALQLLKERKVPALLASGNLTAAIFAAATAWASLPGSPYGQHVQKLEVLQKAYARFLAVS